MSSWQKARARVAVNSRHHGPTSPETLDARRDLESARAEDRVARAVLEIVEQAPLLSALQRDKLAVLLRGGDAA